MTDFIKRGCIQFKTLAPVHIGCGRTVGKKEYLYDKDNGTMIILQMDKVFERICKLGLADRFEKYLLSPEEEAKREGEGDLYGFVRNNRIPEREYRTWSDEIVRVADPDMNYHSIKDINLFARNERGMPYIPASGFKGMLRTVLEMDHYLKDRDQAREMGERIKDEVEKFSYRTPRRDKILKQEDADIDVASVHAKLYDARDRESEEKNLRDQKNDILRGLVVGDSDELSWKDMCICQKYDLNMDGVLRPFNVLRESIKPGVVIRIPIAIDTRVCRYSIEDIVSAIRSFYANYLGVFISRFSNAPRTRGNSTTFFLGGGTGYVSKTVTYGILTGEDAVDTVAKIIDATIGAKVAQKHGHGRDVEKGVSPHILKCTKYNGMLMQMGTCCVTGYK